MTYMQHLIKNWRVAFHALHDFFAHFIHGLIPAIKIRHHQPERKTGRWIPTASGKGRHECSRCHEYAPCYQDGSEHLSTFCVLCGAKMDGGEQDGR